MTASISKTLSLLTLITFQNLIGDSKKCRVKKKRTMLQDIENYSLDNVKHHIK